MELQMEHSEVGPELGTEFQIIEVFSMDNQNYAGSHSVSEVIIDEESGSDDLVVDHNFGLNAAEESDESSGSDAEDFEGIPSPMQPRKHTGAPRVPSHALMRRRRTEEPHLCIVCGKVCMSISGLKVHQKVHMRDSSMDCNLCNMTFPSRAAQSAHMLIHNPEKTHECPCCPLRFASDRALQSHYRVRHKGSETAIVPKLKVAIPRSGAPPLLLPAPPPPPTYTHPPRNRKSSSSSSKKSKSKSKKKREIEHHAAAAGRVTKGKHKQKSSSKPGNSRVKEAKLNRKAFLHATPREQATYIQQVIQESQAGPVPAAAGPSSSGSSSQSRTQVYRCHICKKGFRELHFLERHISIHMMARLHRCPLCNETFDSARAVNAHATEAHDSGTYTCSVCGKNLHKLGSLLNHQLAHERKGEQAGGFIFAK